MIVIPFAGYVLLQFPGLQNHMAQRVVSGIGENMNGSIKIDRIAIVFFNKVMAYGISVTGESGDTLASVDKLSVSLSPSELLRGNIRIRRLFLENGCFNLIHEGPGKYSNINRIFNTTPKPDSLKKPFRMPEMTVDEITLRNMAFSLANPHADTAMHNPDCINFRNLGLKSINAKIYRTQIKNNTISCRIRDLSCNERCGYEIRSLNGIFSLDTNETRLNNLLLMDSWSEISAEYISFGYGNIKDFSDFIHKIHIGADLRNSTLDFRSIGVFAQSLSGNDLRLDISGEISGPVSNLSTYNLEADSDSTSVHISAAITGLPDIYNTFFNVTVKRITTTPSNLSDIISKFSRKSFTIKTPLQDMKASLTGIAYGKLSGFYSIGSLSSEIGSIGYEVELKGEKNTGDRLVSSLWIDTLDIGRFLGNRLLGEVSLDAQISSDLHGSSDKSPSARLDRLHISGMSIKDYEYNDITLAGEYRNGRADIRMFSHDPAFPSIFQGIIDFDRQRKSSPERIRVFLDAPYIDLKAMNIVSNGSSAAAGITANADLKLTGSNILGDILLDNISYANDNGRYHIDSIHIHSTLSHNLHNVTLLSPVLKAGYTSSDLPGRLTGRIKTALNNPSLERLIDIDTAGDGTENGFYDFHLRTYDLSKICNVLMPGLHIADSTTIDMTLDKNDILDIRIQSSDIAFNDRKGRGYDIQDFCLLAGNKGPVESILSINRISSGNMIMDNARMYLGEDGDKLLFKLGYNNADTTYMKFSAGISAWKEDTGAIMADIGIDSSLLNIRNHKWELTPAELKIRPRDYSIEGFRLYSGNDSITVNGAISEIPGSMLSLRMSNFDLDLINSFTSSDLDIQGQLTGEADLFDFFTEMGAAMSIEGTDISLKGEKIGRLSILSRRDLSRNRFNLLVNNYIEDRNPINLSGYFIPGRNYLDLKLSLTDLHMPTVSPFFSGIATISDGYISGNIDINGRPNKLMLNSKNCRIDSLAFTPSYTQVPYIINGPVTINSTSVNLDSLMITDPHGSTAILNGNVSHNFFKNIYLDANLSFNNFQVLDTRERDNDKFYGTAYASGRLGISGYTENLLIDARVTTEGRSSLHIPLSSSSSASTSDLIAFTDFSKSNDSGSTSSYISPSTGQQAHSHRSNIEVRASAGISQGTELFIEMNKQLGDVLRCTGNGNVTFTLNPSRNIFDVKGDYTISEGNYHFVLSIQSRDFIIDEGGTISFNGDFRNTNLNVGATYRTKASISTLIADTTSVGSRRNVNCGIRLQGPLTNPELSFSIDIPDLDPITKGRVESALSTPDKIQKQFLALLISGSFVPDEQSGIINNSTILYSNASEILSNQVNNIFRQLDIPLDLGLNYQPGGTNGSWGMFDVAVSYQAFNNRLIINGNVGNRETSSNWAGDFDAEIKVDRQGKLRITLFTRSVDSYSNYLDNSQRSGFGITYQDEFDTFGDFWRNIFFSRKRREQYELLQLQKAEEELEKEAAEANISKEEVLRPRENPINFLDETGMLEYREQEEETEAVKEGQP